MSIRDKLQEVTEEMRVFVRDWVSKAVNQREITSRASRADDWYAFPGSGEVVGGFEPTQVVAWKPYDGDGKGGCAFLFRRLGKTEEYPKSLNYLTTDELHGIYTYLKGGVYNVGFQKGL